MNNLKFDKEKGNLIINRNVVSPLNKNDFILTLKSKNIKYATNIPNKGWENLSLGVSINGKFFGLNMPYEGDRLTQVWLAWDGGNTKVKGYDTSEKELIQDKNSLTKLLIKILGRSPDQKNHTNDAFLFDWGLISTSASLLSVIATIGIVWNEK